MSMDFAPHVVADPRLYAVLCDGDVQWKGTLGEFLADNEDTLGGAEIIVAENLPVGASMLFGGGAAVEMELARLK